MEDLGGLGLLLRGFGDPLTDFEDLLAFPYRSRDREREVLLSLDDDGDLLLGLASGGLGGVGFFSGVTLFSLATSGGLASASFFGFFSFALAEAPLLLLLELPDELDEPVELAELDRDLLLELPLVLPDELDEREKRTESQPGLHVGLSIYMYDAIYTQKMLVGHRFTNIRPSNKTPALSG